MCLLFRIGSKHEKCRRNNQKQGNHFIKYNLTPPEVIAKLLNKSNFLNYVVPI